MAVSTAGFKGRFSALCNETDERVQIFLNLASRRFNSSVFTDDDLADDAHYYLAAHLLAQDSAGVSGASGQVTSKKVGDVSVNYSAGGAMSSSSLASTSYGREYLAIIRSLALTPFAV